MFTSAANEWLQVLMPPDIRDLLRHPLRVFFSILLSNVVANLWETCFGYLSGLIKGRLCKSSSSTSAPPMARDQAGIRKWTSKIAPACRNGLFHLLSLLEWGGWIWVLMLSLSQGSLQLLIPLDYANYMTFMLMKSICNILEKIFNKQWRQPRPHAQ